MRLLLISLFLLFSFINLVADISLAPLFQDGAILQRDVPLRIWGKANPGERVEVSFGGEVQKTVTSDTGNWFVTLKPFSASTDSRTMTVKGDTVFTVRDVLIGDLWLCAGQSNMAWPVKLSDNAEAEIVEAKYPYIRLYQVPKTSASEPAFGVGGKWEICSPETVADFSAVAYYFGRTLYEELDVPIGLINSSWGATHVESWISSGGLEATPVHTNVKERWERVLAEYPAKLREHQQKLRAWKMASEEAARKGKPFTRRAPYPPDGPGSRMEPAGLYNGMIAPFVPVDIQGVIWYQGESNAIRHAEYEELFKTLILDWRAQFEQPEMPFYFVQLANVVRKYDKTGEEFSHIREAQRRTLSLPATGMAVTVDIGNDNDIHPGNKQDVGRRLAAIALASEHGRTVPYTGPEVIEAAINGNKVHLQFNHAKNLVFKEDDGSGFELAGENEQFFPAQLTLGKTSVILASEYVEKPLHVRYAWGNTPSVTLFNEVGLPSSPFLLKLSRTPN